MKEKSLVLHGKIEKR